MFTEKSSRIWEHFIVGLAICFYYWAWLATFVLPSSDQVVKFTIRYIPNAARPHRRYMSIYCLGRKNKQTVTEKNTLKCDTQKLWKTVKVFC